jgi:FkbM family methyltransferase
MSLKQRVADLMERQFDVRIVNKGHLPILFEQEHLSRFFDHFGVDCVFDVGANSGQYADMIRDKCRFTGPIISFEPIPSLAEALTDRAAGHGDWYIEQSVLAKEAGPVEFNIMAGDQFSSLNKPRTDGPIASEPIAATLQLQSSTLALQFDKYREMLAFKRPFLKMDTQGSDLNVALGAGESLKQFVGLQSELSFDPLYENVPTAHHALEFYRSRGFILSALVPNNAGQFPRLFEADGIFFRSDIDRS